MARVLLVLAVQVNYDDDVMVFCELCGFCLCLLRTVLFVYMRSQAHTPMRTATGQCNAAGQERQELKAIEMWVDTVLARCETKCLQNNQQSLNVHDVVLL